MIVLAPQQLKQIADAAEAAWPRECCGLLVGRGVRVVHVTRVVPAANLAPAANRFDLDPRTRLAVERELRGTPERVVGHYHSHPDGSTRPSATDLAAAYEPDLVWLIAGVVDAQVVHLAAHRLDRPSGRIHPVHLDCREKSACKPRAIPT
ncbi:MAG: M67 family metallopeptidase [Actinomycetota bacterium]